MVYILLLTGLNACKKKTIEHLPVSCDLTDKTGIYVGSYRLFNASPYYSETITGDTVKVDIAPGGNCMLVFSSRISGPRYLFSTGELIDPNNQSSGYAYISDGHLHYKNSYYTMEGTYLVNESEYNGSKQ